MPHDPRAPSHRLKEKTAPSSVLPGKGLGGHSGGLSGVLIQEEHEAQLNMAVIQVAYMGMLIQEEHEAHLNMAVIQVGYMGKLIQEEHEAQLLIQEEHEAHLNMAGIQMDYMGILIQEEHQLSFRNARSLVRRLPI